MFENDEALDEDTEQMVNILNAQLPEEEDQQARPSDLTGLKVQTFGELHRASQAKKNILSTPSFESAFESVRFEMHQVPEDLQEALMLCQRTKDLIISTYKQTLENYLQHT